MAVVQSGVRSTPVRHVQGDWVLAGIDACVVAGGWVTAIILRYDAEVPSRVWDGLWSFLPIAVMATLTSNAIAGLYAGIWRHASIYEARRVLAAQFAGLVVLLPAVYVLDRPVPLSIPLIAAVLVTGLVGAVRFQSRLFAFRRRQPTELERIIVLGAGSAGVALARDAANPGSGASLLCFLDDDPSLHGRRVGGAVVSGSLETLPQVAEQANASYAVLAMPSASPDAVRRVAALAEQAGVVLRVVPPLSDLVNGEVSLRDVRDIEITDLLGREPVDADLDEVVGLVRGRRVLVTGAGGSIGSEIARQVARLGASRLTLLDHDETHLFDTAAGLPVTAVQRLADVRDALAIDQVFAHERPDIVFHAAAHKHVPLLENHPVEAAETNVLGTRIVVDAAKRAGVRHFVFISTDKAVRPSSVMGASKSLGEKVVLSDAGTMTACAVRFGNVLGSRGSVVPTFVKQIRDGGPVTITHARMERYFMSIPEAVRLVLHAAALSNGGEIFMLDMGAPVRIIDLAQRMIRLSGKRPGLDIEVRVTGIRPGEKLAEELRTNDEAQAPTSHPSIVRLTPVPAAAAVLHARLTTLSAAVADRDDARARSVLMGATTTTRSTETVPVQRTSGDYGDTQRRLAWT